MRLAYSLPEAGEILAVSASLVKRLVQTGELRSFKIGGRRVVSMTAMQEYVERLEVAASEELERLRAEHAAKEERLQAMIGATARMETRRKAEAVLFSKTAS